MTKDTEHYLTIIKFSIAIPNSLYINVLVLTGIKLIYFILAFIMLCFVPIWINICVLFWDNVHLTDFRKEFRHERTYLLSAFNFVKSYWTLCQKISIWWEFPFISGVQELPPFHRFWKENQMLQIVNVKIEILFRIAKISRKVERKWRAPGKVKGWKYNKWLQLVEYFIFWIFNVK